MKTSLRILLFVVVTTCSGLFYSCEIDEPLDTDPTDIRNEYLGVWRFTESGFKNGLNQSYIVTIYIDPNGNSSEVLLDNFGNPGTTEMSAIGIVTSNQIVVTSQNMGNGWIVEGSGKKTGDGTMEWSYSLTIGGDKEYYTASAVRQ